MLEKNRMFGRLSLTIIVFLIILPGCAPKSRYADRSSLPYDGSFFDGEKRTFESYDSLTMTKERKYSSFGGPGFFLMQPNKENWRTYYFFFQLRKKIAIDFPDEVPETESDIPIVMNDRVKKFLVYFQTDGHNSFGKWLARSGKFVPMMKNILEAKNMPSDLVYLAMIESGFNVKARSRSGAVGPWQFIEGTALRYGLRVDFWVDERMDPVRSTIAAASYLSDLYEMFNDWELAAAGYNAGENRVKYALQKMNSSDFWTISEYTLPNETKNYVPKLIAALIIAKNPDKYGFEGIEYHEPDSFEVVPVPPQRSLKDIARIIGADYNLLNELNPGILQGSTPPGGKYEINVPKGYGDVVVKKASQIASLNKVQKKFVTHKVRKGETLGGIAVKYGSSVVKIRRTNRLRGSLIRIGQTLKVPVKGTAKLSAAPAKKSKPVAVKRRALNGKGGTHVVKAGETPYQIAKTYGVSLSALMRNNSGIDPNRMQIGDELMIPNGASKSGGTVIYSVGNGDTLWGIARSHGVSVSDIQEWNKLGSANLKPGDKLRIYTSN